MEFSKYQNQFLNILRKLNGKSGQISLKRSLKWSKIRFDQIKKEYDKPKTPYQRLMESGQLTLNQQAVLANRKSKLNPFKLRKEMDEK